MHLPVQHLHYQTPTGPTSHTACFMNTSHPESQTTSLWKSNYQLLILFLSPFPHFPPSPASLSPPRPFSPSQPYAGLHNTTAKSIWPRRLMCWRWRRTYKELSWPSEGWNHPRSPEILKNLGAPAKTERERGREGVGWGAGDQYREFIGSLPIGENVEGKRILKSLEKVVGPPPITK